MAAAADPAIPTKTRFKTPYIVLLFATIGAGVRVRTAEFFQDAGRLGEIFRRTLRVLRGASPGSKRLLRRTIRMQVYFTGAQAVPVAGLLALLVGVGLGELVLANNLGFLIPLFLESLITQHLGPLIAAIVVVARSSSAVAVELGNMRVGGEIEMLESFGIDPYRHLALPRLIGIVLGTVCASFIVTAIALVAMFAVVQNDPSIQGVEFLMQISPASGVRLFVLGIGFGLSIALVSLNQGLFLIPHYTEVPKAASRAVIKSLVLCAIVDAVVSLAAA